MGWLDKFKKEISDPGHATEERDRPLGGLDPESLKLAEELVGGREKKFLGLVLDATGSRQKTWDFTQKILKNIFDHLSGTGGLMVRLVYFSGDKVGDFGWDKNLLAIQKRMEGVKCQQGLTQMVPALRTMLMGGENRLPENVILLGDAFEENLDELKDVLKLYRQKKVRIFSFFDPEGFSAEETIPEELVFQKIAKVTNGVFQEYAEEMYLDELMTAVAAFTAGGQEGLQKLIGQNSRGALALQQELLQIENQNQG